MDVSLEPGRLILQLSRDVFTNAFHLATTTGALPFAFLEVVVVDDLWQFVPIDLSFRTAMARNCDFVARRNRIVRLAGRWRVQLEQMTLAFSFTESLPPPTIAPTPVPR